MKRILTVLAAVAALAAIGAAPAMASQAAPAQSTQALQVPRHQQLNICCGLEDANGQIVGTAFGGQFGVGGVPAVFQFVLLGHVNTPAGWPFTNTRFDGLYHTDQVYQFIQTNGSGGCMQTDSVHSGVLDNPCGSHNAGTYWVVVGPGPRGACTSAGWLVNVGITNHYDPYPYGSAMFANTNSLLYTQSHRPIGGDDQWCPVSF